MDKRTLAKPKHITDDLFIECLEGLDISYDMSLNLKCAVEKRRYTMTQDQVSYKTGRSIATIRRFESGKVDSLFLYAFYMEFFG